MLVWSIPAMTVFLVGGVAWVGSHDLSPRKPIASTVKPVRVQVASLDWKWLFIYPDQGVASVNRLTIPVGHADQSGADLFGRDEQLLRAAAWQPDLHHGGNDHPSSPAGRPFWNVSRIFRSVQRRGLCRHAFRRRCRDGRKVRPVARRSAQRRSGAQCEDLRGSGEAECHGRAIHLSLGRARSVRQDPGLRNAVRRCDVPQVSDSQ